MTDTNAPEIIDVNKADMPDLIKAIANRYNQEAEDWDRLVSDNQRLTQERDGYKRQAQSHQADIEKLQHNIAQLTEENDRCRKMVLEAENIATRSIAIQTENGRMKSQIFALQKEIQELKQAGDPKKLKATIAEKNSKLKDLEHSKQKLQRAMKDEQHKQEKSRIDLNKAIDKIAQLQTQLQHDTGSGLYHKDHHHLIIWPQKTKILDENGNEFEGRSLLYLHQSGRGGLMTMNPHTNEVNLCAAPKGGLRPCADTQEFAKNWLFKVNMLQEGMVREEDMIAVNYNA